MVPSDSADQSVDTSDARIRGVSGTTDLQLHPLLFLLLAIVAGAIFVGVSQAYFPAVPFPAEMQIEEPTPEQAAAQTAAEIRSRVLSAAVAAGVLGLLMGGFLGIGEAVARRFTGGVLLRLVVAVVLATVMGALSGLLGQGLLERVRSMVSLVPIARTTLAHACTLAIFGLGVGAAAGLVGGGGRRVLTCLGAGAISGILVGLVFPVFCAFVMYRVETEVAVIPGGVVGGRSELPGLLLWTGLLAAAIGIILPLVTREKAS